MSASFRPVSDRFSSVGIVCPFKSNWIWKWHTERLKGRRVSSSVKMLCSDPATKKTFKWNRVANRQRMPLLRWSNALSLSFGYANLLRWNRTAYSWRGKIAIPAVYWTLLWKLAVLFLWPAPPFQFLSEFCVRGYYIGSHCSDWFIHDFWVGGKLTWIFERT